MLRFASNTTEKTVCSYTPVAQRRGDITLHIEEHLTQDQLIELKQALRSIEGVEDVHIQKTHVHLLVVYYDTFLTTSDKIFAAVQNHSLNPYRARHLWGPQIHAQMISL
ncbi:MAG: hypothetical protein HQL54_05775 [Magnetococcales bacterium]|nr:hypothetical protein [Magnetococcales bacterium]